MSKVKKHNLEAIISVGYRVNSTQATHFRIWATKRLKEYIIKGFTMDNERLKNPNNISGKDYFEEQLVNFNIQHSSFNLELSLFNFHQLSFTLLLKRKICS